MLSYCSSICPEELRETKFYEGKSKSKRTFQKSTFIVNIQKWT